MIIPMDNNLHKIWSQNVGLESRNLPCQLRHRDYKIMRKNISKNSVNSDSRSISYSPFQILDQSYEVAGLREMSTPSHSLNIIIAWHGILKFQDFQNILQYYLSIDYLLVLHNKEYQWLF